MNASEVLKGDRGLTSAFLEWSPAIDGVEVIDDPRTLLAEGKVADVPVMIGFNADEGSMFARAPKDLNESQCEWWWPGHVLSLCGGRSVRHLETPANVTASTDKGTNQRAALTHPTPHRRCRHRNYPATRAG